MPKGVPKSQGEKLKDDFDTSYKQMKKEFRRGKTKRKEGKKSSCEGGCECEKKPASKKKK